MKNIDIHPIEEREIWEAFILKHNPQSLFSSYAWGEVQKKNNRIVYRLGIFVEQELVGIAQVVVVSARRGTYLHLRHAPIWSEKTIFQLYLWQELVRQLKRLAQKHHAMFIRMSPLLSFSPELRTIFQKLHMHPAPIHAMDAEHCWVLDLTPPTETLLAGMRKTTRYLVRQAEKLGVEVERSTDIETFNTLYCETAKRQGFVMHESIVEEFREFSKTGAVELFLAKHNQELLAGALIIYYGNQAIYHHGASRGGKVPASYLLQWVAIQSAKKRGMRWYNFWGIAPADKPRHPWQGLTLFKQGFGGEVRQFTHAHDLPLSPLYGLSYTIDLVRRVRRGY